MLGVIIIALLLGLLSVEVLILAELCRIENKLSEKEGDFNGEI